MLVLRSETQVIKVDATGRDVWAKQLGTGPFLFATSLAVDLSGNVLVSGAFQEMADLGEGHQLTGSAPAFFAKYDPLMKIMWIRTFDGPGENIGSVVAADAAGDVYAGGHCASAVDLGGGVPPLDAPRRGAFLVKWDPFGKYLWSKRFNPDGGLNGSGVNRLAVDPVGNVVMAGTIYGIGDFGGGPQKTRGESSIFVVKFDKSGDLVWSRVFDGPSSVGGLTIDRDGSVFLAGSFDQPTVEFGRVSLRCNGCKPVVRTRTSATEALGNAYLTKLDSAGDVSWAKSYGHDGTVVSTALTLGADGAVVMAGVFQGRVDFGSGPLSSAGRRDAFVAIFDRNGIARWSQRFGGPGGDGAEDVVAFRSSNFLVTGWFEKSIDFGHGAIPSSSPVEDAFLANLALSR